MMGVLLARQHWTTMARIGFLLRMSALLNIFLGGRCLTLPRLLRRLDWRYNKSVKNFNPKNLTIFIFIFGLSFFVFASQSSAATLEVGTGRAYSTIQSAVN